MKNSKKVAIILTSIVGAMIALAVIFSVNADALKKGLRSMAQAEPISVTQQKVTTTANETASETEQETGKETVKRTELETEDADARKEAGNAQESIIRKANANQENENRKIKEAAEKRNKEIEEYNQKVREHNARLSNYYKNENPEYAPNNVKVHPAYMIYDDEGSLYVAYYLTNGFNHPIYAITLQSFSIYTMDGRLIAEIGSPISFGEAKGINANAYATQEIVFKGDNLKIKDADLSNIKYTSRVTNRY